MTEKEPKEPLTLTRVQLVLGAYHQNYGCKRNGREWTYHGPLCTGPDDATDENLWEFTDDDASAYQSLLADSRKRPHLSTLDPVGYLVEKALPRMRVWCDSDPRVSDEALQVYIAFNLSARAHASIELPASRAWIQRNGAVTEAEARSALNALERYGYLVKLRWPWEKGRPEPVVTRKSLLLWVRNRKGGKPPRPIRLTLAYPHYERLRDYEAPTETTA